MDPIRYDEYGFPETIIVSRDNKNPPRRHARPRGQQSSDTSHHRIADVGLIVLAAVVSFLIITGVI